MLANVHLPIDDRDVWVEVDVRCPDGAVRTVRRTLTADYSATSDCTTALTIDGQACADINILGIPLGDPPLAAPVLLQHNLRYVLSTEPQKRADYFRALLELSDLDVVREAVRYGKNRLSDLPSLHWLEVAETLRSSVGENLAAVSGLQSAVKAVDNSALVVCLVRVAQALNDSVQSENAEEVIAELQEAREQAEEKVFPIGALAPRLDGFPNVVDPHRLERPSASYNEQLQKIDLEIARLAPIIEAVLGYEELGNLVDPTNCPVCDNGTLSPERIERLRATLADSETMQHAAKFLTQELARMMANIDQVSLGLKSVIPSASAWNDGRWDEVTAHLDRLLHESGSEENAHESIDAARGAFEMAELAFGKLQEVRRRAQIFVEDANRKIAQRAAIQDSMSAILDEVNGCIEAVAEEARKLAALSKNLQRELGESLRAATLPTGSREIHDLLTHREQLLHEIRVSSQRKKAKRRINAIGRVLEDAEKALVDARFNKMGAEISTWWSTLRPEELVQFGGLGRRASGRRYVNLSASLLASTDTSPEFRDAVGVFSDSQLNALGLSAFLARQVLIGSPFVVLDDPLPGYDPDHRVTFTLKTLSTLLDSGIQVIICTHDPKFAVNIVEAHSHRGLEHYELSLSNMAEGTVATNAGDVFGRYLLEAQDSMASLTVEGRRNASNALRRAAERLAKQIIATGRTEAGVLSRVSDVEDKVLGELIPEVLGFALGNDERGRWNLWKNSLNPSAHDSEVPSVLTLRTVLGDIKRLKKNHESHWSGGLIK